MSICAEEKGFFCLKKKKKSTNKIGNLPKIRSQNTNAIRLFELFYNDILHMSLWRQM